VIRRILHRLMGWTYDSEHISGLNFTGRSDRGPSNASPSGMRLESLIGTFGRLNFDEVTYDKFAAANKLVF
jgi:hypothetical protein